MDAESSSSLVWSDNLAAYEEDLARLMAVDGPLASVVEG